MNVSRSRAILFLILTAILWSSGGLLIKLIQWNAPAIAATRSFIAALLLFTLYRSTKFTWSRATIGAAVCYAITVTLFVAATKLTTAANAILLQYTAPVHVALFGGWFLGEKTTRLDWLVIGLVLVGMTLFFVDGLSTVNMLGNGTAIVSGFAFAWFTLFMRKQSMQNLAATGNAATSLEPVLLGNLLTALVGMPFVVGSIAEVSLQSWIGLALLGTLQLGLSYVLYTAAVGHVTALEIILIPVIEPLLNPIWVLLATGEQPSIWALVGGIVVIGAVTARSLLMLRQQPSIPSTP